MSDWIDYASEVYYKIPRGPDGLNKIVPVRGVYVTGEWKPPVYIDPCVQVVEITGAPALVETYTTANADTYDPTATSLHLYDAYINTDDYKITWYTRGYNNQTDKHGSSIHLIDIDIDATVSADWYSRGRNSQTDKHGSSIHLIDVDIDPGIVTVDYPTKRGGNLPEPMVRMTELFAECTVVSEED